MNTLVYITKYLPVEGEIKEGDPWMTRMDSVTTLVPPKDYDFPRRKVKLFLCSRDIQVGDKCYGEILMGDNWHTCTIVDNCKKMGCVKVIGEVSPNAIWVKEGMEFNEYEEWYYAHQTNNYLWKVNVADENSGRLKEAGKRIKLKCPTCNTYH